MHFASVQPGRPPATTSQRRPWYQRLDSDVSWSWQVEGVHTVSDLHVWALKPSIPLLAAHITLRDSADPR